MKNWLRRKLQSFLYMDEMMQDSICVELDESMDWPDPLSFKIQKANGGTIIEVRHYDRKNDNRYNAIHVVPDGEDLQSSLAKIMTYESLKK